MKYISTAVCSFFPLFMAAAGAAEGQSASPEKFVAKQLHWLNHSSFRADTLSGKVIYFDPFHLKDGQPKADLILITHDHYDHFSLEDIKKVVKESTVIVLPFRADKLGGAVKTVEPGEKFTAAGFSVETVPAYNISKPFHPREKGYVGYIISIDGVKVYHAGDTDLFPEMRNISADVALLPIGGTYTMDPSEAVLAAGLIKPSVAIPMHYGSAVGKKSDAKAFAEQCQVPVVIMEPYK